MKQISTVFLMIGIATTLLAQSKEHTVNVPLSNPGQRGTLDLYTHHGKVEVVGYDGQEVVITISSHIKDDDKQKSSRAGLKVIPNIAPDLEITEDDNLVEVDTDNNSNADYFVKVPKNFDLNLGAHHGGDIKVEGVNGTIELNTHHGGIEFVNVGGSVVADTHHGAIVGSFATVDQNKSMAFSTWHGDVDVTFPSSFNSSVKLKSTKGNIYTDFDMTTSLQEPKTTKDRDGTKIKIGGWMFGQIGNGGPELMFSTYSGDVIIRKG